MPTQQFRGKGANKRKLTDADRAEIVQLYTTQLPDGTWMGSPTIARRFGVTAGTVSTWLWRAGVEKRSMKEAHSGGKRCKPVKNVPVGEPPLCGCGCGATTEWNQRKNRWNRCAEGHYRQRGAQNPNWRGGAVFEWEEARRAVLERDGYACRACGTTADLHVHHRDQDRTNNASSNLITLCRADHTRVHMALRAKEVMPV